MKRTTFVLPLLAASLVTLPAFGGQAQPRDAQPAFAQTMTNPDTSAHKHASKKMKSKARTDTIKTSTKAKSMRKHIHHAKTKADTSKSR